MARATSMKTVQRIKKTDALRAMRERALTPSAADQDAVEIGEFYAEGRKSLVDSVRYLFKCGVRLAAKKASLEHGAWLSWLQENEKALGFASRLTAARLMKLASNVSLATHLDTTKALLISRQVWGHSGEKQEKRRVHQTETASNGTLTTHLDELGRPDAGLLDGPGLVADTEAEDDLLPPEDAELAGLERFDIDESPDDLKPPTAESLYRDVERLIRQQFFGLPLSEQGQFLACIGALLNDLETELGL